MVEALTAKFFGGEAAAGSDAHCAPTPAAESATMREGAFTDPIRGLPHYDQRCPGCLVIERRPGLNLPSLDGWFGVQCSNC